jgi:Ca2+-binding EF-hand superfamily protein
MHRQLSLKLKEALVTPTEVHIDHHEHWNHGQAHVSDRQIHPGIHGLKRMNSGLSSQIASDHPDDDGITLFEEHVRADKYWASDEKALRDARAAARKRRATLRQERKEAKLAEDAARAKEAEDKLIAERLTVASGIAESVSRHHERRAKARAQRLANRRQMVAKMEVEPRVFNTDHWACFLASFPIDILGIPAIAAKKLNLSDSHLRRLFRLFRAFDKDRSGRMSHEELITLMNVPDTEFVRVMLDRIVFAAIEMKGDHDIDFDEFVLACCVICTSSKQDMTQTLFHVFDNDDSGYIDHNEMKRIIGFIKESGGNKGLENTYTKIMNSLQQEGDRLFLDKFLSLSQRFPLVFDPVFRMRTALIEETFGRKEWSKLRKAYYRRAASQGIVHSFQQQIFVESMRIYEHHQEKLRTSLDENDDSDE